MDGGGRVGKFKALPKEGKLSNRVKRRRESTKMFSKYISSESLRKELLECRVGKRWMRGRRTQHKTQLRTRTRLKAAQTAIALGFLGF